MEKAVEIFDRYTDEKERTVLTFREHGIPGLRMIGRHCTSHAKAPLGLHCHPGCFEFTYLVQGNVSFSVDGQDYPLSGGDLFVTFPDEPHSTGNAPLSLHQMYWFQLEADDPGRFLFMERSRAEWMLQQLRSLPGRVIRLNPGAEMLFKDIFQNLARKTELKQVQSAGLLGVLLCQILSDARQTGPALSPDIHRAEEYIKKNIREDLTMEELAGEALLSVSRFKEKFKAQTGSSPRNYVNFHKIEAAKQLLLEGKSITDTAMELGFSGSDYFSVVFRRYTFQSPTEFLLREKEKK